MSIPVETEKLQNDTLEFKAKQLLRPTTLPTERYELKTPINYRLQKTLEMELINDIKNHSMNLQR